LLASAACASSGSGSTASTNTSGGAAAKPSRGAPNLITADEIAHASAQNAYDVIQKLRPTMFRPTQISSANAQANGELVIYVDNNRYGDITSLRQITASSIASIRAFTSSEAQMRWGPGHPSGAIEVVTKR
jgi:hypothetical protein